MHVTLSGVLKDPYNNPLANTTIVFETEKTSNQTLKSTSAKVNTDNVGAYSITVPYGTYTIKVKQSNNNTYHTIATGIRVSDSTTADNLNTLITEIIDDSDYKPEYIIQIENLKQQVYQARDEVVGIQIELQGAVDTIESYESRLSAVEGYEFSAALSGLNDTSIISQENNDILVFDQGVWKNLEIDDILSSRFPQISNDQWVYYDGTDWVSGKPTLQITDITNLGTELTNRSVVGHTHSISNIIGLPSTLDNKANKTHTHTFANLTDVDISNLQTGEILVYNGIKFVNQTYNPDKSIFDLTDVNSNASPSNGDVLVYDSTNGYFTTTKYDPNTAIDDLVGVEITDATDEQILTYNGFQWVNTSKSPFGWDAVTSIVASTDIDQSGNISIDISEPSGFFISLDENIDTIYFTGAPSNKFVTFAVAFKQDAVGGRSITSINGLVGTLIQPSSVPNSTSIMTFTSFDGGVTIYQSDVVDDDNYSGLIISDIANLSPTLNDLDTRLSTVEGNTTAVSIDTLSDTNINALSNNQFLRYNGSEWVNTNIDYSMISNTPVLPQNPVVDINDLSDVSITSASNNQFLRYNGSEWVNQTVNVPVIISNLNDVEISTPQNNEVLAWNSSASRFENKNINSVVSNLQLQTLSDVEIVSTPMSMQVITWDTSYGKWINKTLPRATTLGTLTDTNISVGGPSEGEYLRWTNDRWVNTNIVSSDISDINTVLGDKADTVHTHVISDVTGLQTELDNLSNSLTNKADSSHTHVVADITDIVVTTPSTGQILKYDTNQWVNGNVAVADVTGLNDELLAKSDVGHTHAITDISDLSNQLDAKADTVHSHGISDVTGLQDALDTKADATHTHVINDIIDFDVESPLEGHVLVFDTVDSKWVNSPALDDKADVATVTALADQIDALEGQGLMKLGGVPIVTSVSSQPRFYYKSFSEKKAANSDTLAIYAFTDRSYLQLESIDNGTNYGGKAYIYDKDNNELWNNSFVTSDFILDEKIEIIDYDMSENDEVFQITILLSYVYQGTTYFQVNLYTQKKTGTYEPYNQGAFSVSKDSTFDNAQSIGFGDQKVYVVFGNDQGESFVQRRSLDTPQHNSFNNIINYDAVAASQKIKVDRKGGVWTQYSVYKQSLQKVGYLDDGSISAPTDLIGIDVSNTDWRFLKDDFVIFTTPTKLGITKHPYNGYEYSEITHGQTFTNPKLHLDYWRKSMSIQDGVDSYDVVVTWRGYWRDSIIESGHTQLINQDSLDNQTFEIDKINGLQAELDTLQTNVDDTVSLVDNKQDKVVNTIESTEGLNYGAVGGYVPFDININGIIVTVIQESTANPGAALSNEIVSAINAANIPNISAEVVSSSNIRIKSDSNEPIVITASGNDNNGTPVVGTSSATGLPVGVKEPNSNHNMIRQEDVYGLTSILNNIRVETLTEVVSLADTEVVLTLTTITVGDTPMVFVDGAPIADFTVDSDTQITLGSGYSAGTKTVTVVQNNVRFD